MDSRANPWNDQEVVGPTHLAIYLSTCLPVYLPIYLTTYPPSGPDLPYLSFYPSIYLSAS